MDVLQRDHHDFPNSLYSEAKTPWFVAAVRRLAISSAHLRPRLALIAPSAGVAAKLQSFPL